MLVNATNMLLKARDGHYGVGQFNINNLEWTRSILLQAQAMQSPVILGVSEGAGKYMTGFKTVAAMVRAMDESLGITVPVALHLDHGTYEGAKACIEECAKITALGVDFLAAGIGNIHGIYPANWKGLDFEALERIHQATNNIPLVLHGGTGIPDEMVQKAIRLGVSKINVNTDCQLVFAEATRKYIEAGKDQQGKGYDPRKLLKPGADAIMDKVKEKVELFGSANKA